MMIADGKRAWRKLLVSPLLLVSLALVLVACGLSTSDQPEPISQDNMPPDLRDPKVEEQEMSTTLDELETVTVWFVRVDEREAQLEPVDRGVPKPSNAARRLDVLLKEGPTAAENRQGLSTAIPGQVGLTQPPERRESTLVVSLSAAFYELQGNSARNAFAQLVFTATEMSGVDSVQFLLDGRVVSALDGAGQSRDDPLGRCDYDNLVDNCE